MKKLWRKGLSLLLALCMILSMGLVPVNSHMPKAEAAGVEEDTDFYKIVHLDAGRKYYSVDNIKKLIDDMAVDGYNQLELYFSDNQGFRFELNDMVVKANDRDYDLADALGNGIYQTSDTAPGKCEPNASNVHFRPSLEEDGKNWLTEADMIAIISYANSKEIQIVPAMDLPGHFGAVLDAFPEFKYSISNTSLDLANPRAKEFALAVLQKYVDWFASHGCRYFNICADEYGYDIGQKPTGSLYTDFVRFMDEAAKIIVEKDMTPRAFNDYFYAGADVTTSDAFKKYEIYFWSGSQEQLQTIQENRHKVINTSEHCYYALGSLYYTLDVTQNGVEAFKPDQIFPMGKNFPIDNPAGAMFCIWSDKGYLESEVPDGDGGKAVLEQAKPYMDTFAQKLGAEPVEPEKNVIRIELGQTYKFGEGLSGDYSNWVESVGLTHNDYVTADVVTREGTPAEIANEKASELSDGAEIVIGDGSNYLRYDGTEFSTVGEELATKWKVVKSNANYNFQYENGEYLLTSRENPVLSLKNVAGVPWIIIDTLELRTAWDIQYKISLSDDPKVETNGAETNVGAYLVTPATEPKTDITLTGTEVGKTEFTDNGKTYTVIVWEKETISDCEHNLVHVDYISPTEFTYGYKEHWVCSECARVFVDGEAKSETTMFALREDKLAHKHDLQSVEYVPATLEADGNLEHYKCTKCGKLFWNEQDEKPIENVADVILSRLVAHTLTVEQGYTHTCEKCVVRTRDENAFESLTGEVKNSNEEVIATYTVEKSTADEQRFYTYTLTFTGVKPGKGTLSVDKMQFDVIVKEECTHKNGGGVATCVSGAICSLCGREYGEKDPENHAGPFERVNSTEIYTGDIVCDACNETVEEGQPIDENEEVIHINEYGIYEGFIKCNNDITDTLNMDETDKTIVPEVEVTYQEYKKTEKTQIPDMSRLADGAEVIISDGTYYLVMNADGTMRASSNEEEATRWEVIFKEDKFGLKRGEKYLHTGYDYGVNLSSQNEGERKFIINTAGNLQITQNPGNEIVLNEGVPRMQNKDENNDATAKLYIPGSITESGIFLTIHAGAVGDTSFVLDDTTYRIAVDPVDVSDEKKTIEYAITNEHSKGSDGLTEKTIKATDPRVSTEDGVSLAEIVPKNGSNNTFVTEYWFGTKHPESNKQGFLDEGGQGGIDVTKAEDSVRYRYIRFWQTKWSVSWNQEDWVTVEPSDQLLARYLLQTNVTTAITTEVQDWGKGMGYDRDNWCVLDFATKFASGDTFPSPNAYYIPEKSIFYHADAGDNKVDDQAMMGEQQVNLRRVDTIIGRETADREVYMITLTPSSDEYNPIASNASQLNADTRYTYDGTEKIVWLLDADTSFPTEMPFHHDFTWGETPTEEQLLKNEVFGPEAVYRLNHDELLDEEGNPPDWTQIPDTERVPEVDHVSIFNEHGMLVTYYIRVKSDAASQVRVHYKEWTETEDAPDFHSYGIAVEEDVVFDDGFAMDKTSETGLVNNTIVNNLNRVQTVDSRLEIMYDVPVKYRTGGYTLYMVRRSENGKDVYLYYAKSSLDRYVVADFGLPIVIDWNLLRGELNPQNYVITDIEWLPEYRDAAGTIVAEAPKFCDVENGGLRLVIDDDTDSETDPDPKYIYTPNKQINGLEVPLYFKVTMMAHTVEENGDKKEVETQNVYAVHIVPATTVYYEPVKEFIGIEGDWELQGEADIPQKSVAVLKDDLPYGQDPAYEAANGPDAAGCYLQAKTKGDTAIIDFTGTGIELYANCTPDTGLIMAVLQDKEGKVLHVYSVDTKVSGGNTEGTNFQTWDNVYNAPVITISKLVPEQYRLRVTYYGKNADPREAGVRLDGFRITHPIIDSFGNQISKIVYLQNNEAKPVFEEVRDKVLAAVNISENEEITESEYYNQIKESWGQVLGQVDENTVAQAIILGSDGISEEGDINMDILDNGPKNEFYLMPGKTLIMSVRAKYRYQLGMKCITEASGFCDTNGGEEFPVTSKTDMFYRVTAVPQMKKTDDGTETPTESSIITIKNTGENILSLTRLKALPNDQSMPEEESVFTDFTEASFTSALMCLGNFIVEEPDVPEETIPEETQPEETIPEETVPEETKPIETQPTETQPTETQPTETKPAETKPAETKPVETRPAEVQPETSAQAQITAPTVQAPEAVTPETVTPETLKPEALKPEAPAPTPEDNRELPENVAVDDIKDVADNKPVEEGVKPLPEVPGEMEAAPGGIINLPQQESSQSTILWWMFGLITLCLAAVTGLTVWKRRKR